MKKKLKNQPLIIAMPVVLVATQDGERINFAPHGQCGHISGQPPVVYISVIKGHTTAQMIEKTQKFSLNIPTPALLGKVKWCGSVSGVDKSGVFEVFYGESGTPLVSACPINLSCEVIKTVELEGHLVFFGEVAETFVDDSCLVEDFPDVEKTDPLICSLDGNFWSLRGGQVLG